MSRFVNRSMHWGWTLSLLLVVSWAPLIILAPQPTAAMFAGYLGPLIVWFLIRWICKRGGR